ncbi:MAG: hypothetical protein LBL43_08690, partial [Treponema sp.]|nr:hypothetical protein [Treponema sp.]
VQGFSFLSSVFDEGTWYWRVTPVYPQEFQGTPEASPVSSFTIERRREEAAVPVPPAPAEPPAEIPPSPRIPGRVTLRAPVRGEGIPGLEAVRRPASARWTAPEAVGSSRFVLSRNPNPLAGSPIMDMANPPFTVPLPPLPPGTYYWTVQARTPDGLDMSPPEPFAFRVLPVRLEPLSLDAPPEGSLIAAGDAQDRPGRLIWSSAEKPAFSRLILSRDPDPAAGVPVLDILDPPFTVPLPPLPPGTYYWTLQARTPEGFNISPGKPAVFQIAPFPPLEAPQGMIPREGSTLQIGKNGTLNFSWEKTADADAYILSFFNEADPETPLFQTEPRAGTAYIHRDVSALDTGNFFWRLEPLRTGPGGVPLRRGEKGECHFRIIVPQPESPRPRDPGTLYGN